MPKKIITTTVTLGIEDPQFSYDEVLNAHGHLIRPKIVGLGHAAPGTPVTLDAAEADRIIARYGGEVVKVIPDKKAGDPPAA